MLYKRLRFSFWLTSILFLSLCPLGLHGQEGTDAQAKQSGMAGNNKAQTVTVTGCLQKGTEANGFYITGEDGKNWELSGGRVNLGEHVGHKVSLTGRAVHRSKADEAKMEAKEKAEAGDKEYGDLRVVSLKMIATSCT